MFTVLICLSVASLRQMSDESWSKDLFVFIVQKQSFFCFTNLPFFSIIVIMSDQYLCLCLFFFNNA